MVADTSGVITHYIDHQVIVEPEDFIGTIYDAGAAPIIPRMMENQV